MANEIGLLKTAIRNPLFNSLRNKISDLLAERGYIIIHFDDARRLKILKRIHKIKQKSELLMFDDEVTFFYTTIEQIKKVPGDFAEVGVYKGASAKVICEAKGSRALHLFDTFEGQPKVEKIDQPLFREGNLIARLDDVKKTLRKFKNVHYYKGLFPDTGKKIVHKKFCFVNLDADLYLSTIESLKFFYPRMSKGGVIVLHDYNYAPGVKKAVDEFFKDKAEPVLEITSSQCCIVKS